MAKIPEEIKDFLKTHLVFVATVGNKGVPNVVPKGDIAILGDDEVVFADLYTHQTRDNLIQNPNISLCVVNPASYTGYQIKGTARIVERGKEYEELESLASGSGQLSHIEAKYAIRIKINKIIDIGYSRAADKEISG